MDTNDKLTLWAERNGISVVIEQTKRNPYGAHWAGATHFKAIFRRPEEWAGTTRVRQFTTHYSQGKAFTSPPSVGAILYAVMDDVLCYTQFAGSFETYCKLYGQDEDGDSDTLAAERRAFAKHSSMVRRAEIFFGPCQMGSLVEIMTGQEDPEEWDFWAEDQAAQEAC